MSYTNIFFDLDDTIYSSDNGLWNVIRTRMSQYMVEKLGLPEEEVSVLRRKYYITYGTTLRGLQTHYDVDADDYLDYVHDINLQEYLRPLPGLREMVISLPQTRWIFTNADAKHATRVLDVMQLSGCFQGIIDVKAIQFACKPEQVAYQRALALAGDPNPQQCVLLDDSPTNLLPARQLGFTTILINQNGDAHPDVDHTILNLLSLPQVLPVLWDHNGKR
jgi:putative hydrolase of the HAD superfamily